MKEFKARLLELVSCILFMAVLLGVAFGSYALLVMIHPLAPGIIAFSVGALLLVGGAITGVYKFIKWLFIEPFRKGRNQ